MDDFLTLENFNEFAKDYSCLTHLDILVATMSGNFRGKRVLLEDIKKIINASMSLPRSITSMDAAGGTPLLLKEGEADGDPDTVFLPLKHSLALVPWDKTKTRAQIMLNPDTSHKDYHDYQNPRAILQKAVNLLHNQNLYPQAAIELEFFLIDPNSLHKNTQPPNAQKNQRQNITEQCLSSQALEDFSPFLEKLQEALTIQNLNPQSLSAEYSPAQFEINQPHGKDLLFVCDQAMLLKHAVKSVAKNFGLEATFMAKPYLQKPGSGLHIHCSLLNKHSENIFAGKTKDNLSNTFLWAIGGLAQTACDFFPLLAPTSNSYRRFAGGDAGGFFAPVNSAWGRNNRNVALRIPLLHSCDDTRVEHRIAGADSNPYLAMAAILFGIDYGINNKIDPGQESIAENINQQHDLPFRWGEALYRFKISDIAKHYLGDETHKFLHSYYASEYEAYHNEIPQRDLQRYLEGF